MPPKGRMVEYGLKDEVAQDYCGIRHSPHVITQLQSSVTVKLLMN